ncbi:MAG: hypothetical protein ABIH99_02980 [Candidatus Micrarchaeota archaeon]
MKVEEKNKLFITRVADALKRENFSGKEIKNVRKILENSAKRNVIVIQGTESAFRIAQLTSEEVRRLEKILVDAYKKVMEEQEPFIHGELTELEDVLKQKVSTRMIKRLELDLSNSDEMLVDGLQEALTNLKMRISVPEKKVEEKVEQKQARKDNRKKIGMVR